MSLQYYSTNDPKINELVLVHFTEKCDAFFNVKLLEYPYIGIMNFQDATKKKKIYTWNKYVQLNRDMVAKVDSIDYNKKIIQLSLAYLEDMFQKKINMTQIQQNLLIYFNENKYMEKFINSLCIRNNYNYNHIWISLIHKIDINRRNYNEINEDNLSLFKYFIENYKIINDFEDIDLNQSIKESIINLLIQKNEIISNKIISKIGIISLNGIDILIDFIKNILKDFNNDIIIKYDTAPYYTIESSSLLFTKCDHEKLINKMESTIKENNLSIYLKV